VHLWFFNLVPKHTHIANLLQLRKQKAQQELLLLFTAVTCSHSLEGDSLKLEQTVLGFG